MTNIVFLDAETLGSDIDISSIKGLGNYIQYGNTNEEDVFSRCAEATIVITNKVVLKKEVLLKLPKLRLICVAATGMNNIDLSAAKDLDIDVKNVVNYSTESVAQHTFAMLLALVNQITYHDQYVKDGLYSNSSIFTNLTRPYFELSGKKLGILGMGNIGRRVAQIGSSFGMSIAYSSLSGVQRTEDYSNITLDQLISTSDIISIHSPLNQYTKGLVDKEFIQKMKKSAIIINAGRGGIIDEKALCQAINNEEIAGACLDVFECEPLPSSNPFLSVKYPQRLILSPHIAWASQEARRNLVNQICHHISKFLSHKSIS